MKRFRPYIPFSVRVQVAERQVQEIAGPHLFSWKHLPLWLQLNHLLAWLFMGETFQLDHDPALILRPFDEQTGKYFPHANDPEFLIYRAIPDHKHKTTGRKSGAERTVTTKGSDIGLKRKFAKLEKRTKASRRPKRKIPSRPFPKRIA